MRRKPMNKSRVIAELPGCAQVQVCDAGCGHITFPPVTLHFANEAELRTTIHAFLARVTPHLPESGDGDSCVEVAYGPVSLYLTPAQAQDLMTLLRQAEQALASPIPEAVSSRLRPPRFAVARGDAARGAGEA
jgi:hypothetical protein